MLLFPPLCVVLAYAMSEKWMWNGASGASTESTSSRASRNGSGSTNAPSLVACMCAKSMTGRTQSARRLISTQSSSEPRSRTRPMTSIPNGTARSLPSSRSRTSASCSTTASIESSRLRPSRKPGWKTTTSAPDAAAIPALRSSAPSADDHLRRSPRDARPSRRGRVHRQRDVVLAGELAEPLGPRIVHPEARLEVDLAGVVAALEHELHRPLGAVPLGHARGPDADPAHGADCTGRVHVG